MLTFVRSRPPPPRKCPFLARGSVESGRGPPVPRQKVVEAAHGVAAGHAREHVLEIGEGLDVVELGGGYEGAHGRPAVGAAVRSGKRWCAQRFHNSKFYQAEPGVSETKPR